MSSYVMSSETKSTAFSAYGHDCIVQTATDVDVVLKLFPGDSLCARIRRKLSRLIVVSEKCKVNTSNLRSFGAFLKEQERQLTQYPHKLHPQSILRLCWEIFIIILILLDLFLHAIDLPFMYDNVFVSSFSWIFIRIFIEALLLTNILVGLITGYYDDIAQEIVFSSKKIFLHKLKTDVLFFISVVPIQIPAEYYITPKHRGLLILLYLLKLPLLFTFHGYYKRILEFFEVKHHVYLKTIIIIYMILYVHLLCCYLIFVKRSVSHYIGLVYRSRVNATVPAYIYVSGIYQASIVLYTAGYGKAEPANQLENLFICISWYLSRLFFIFVLACFMESIKVSTSSRSRYLALEHELEEYMRHKQLPSYIRNRIYTYYEFRFQRRYFREDEILNTISGQLKQEINMHACKKLVENVSFFRNLPMNLLVRIISCLQIQVFLTNDVIIRAGTPGKCMYFISTGTVAVYTKSGKEICHLKDGDHFGEVSLLYKDTLRIASVISIEISEIYTLDKKDFVKAIYPYPDLLSNIQNIAADRMETAFMLDEHNKSELAQRKMLYDIDH